MNTIFIKLIKNNIWKALLIALLVLPGLSFAQTLTINGVVKDEKGETLPGVSVKVKGGAIATQTDLNGKFTIGVPDKNTKLEFSYVGFNPVEEVVGDRKIINITLKENINSLQE